MMEASRNMLREIRKDLEVKVEKVCGVNPRAVRVQIAELGLRNNQVAERIGMTEQTFSRKLNGKTPWTIVELCMLADNLCCTTDFLLGRFK